MVAIIVSWVCPGYVFWHTVTHTATHHSKLKVTGRSYKWVIELTLFFVWYENIFQFTADLAFKRIVTSDHYWLLWKSFGRWGPLLSNIRSYLDGIGEDIPHAWWFLNVFVRDPQSHYRFKYIKNKRNLLWRTIKWLDKFNWYNTNSLVPHSSSIPPEKNWKPEVVLGGLHWGELEVKRAQSLGEVHRGAI